METQYLHDKWKYLSTKVSKFGTQLPAQFADVCPLLEVGGGGRIHLKLDLDGNLQKIHYTYLQVCRKEYRPKLPNFNPLCGTER
jgi:hypothetical protein